MTDRYCHQDIDFFHKKTCTTLLTKLGPYAPLAFLSLCAEAKRSRIPGVVIVASEPDFWKQLGLYGEPLGFDMDEFLRATGRIKQTSRTRVGRLSHVVLSNYGRWQNDFRRENERERKSRKRQESTADTGRTGNGQGVGQKADRDRDRERTPLTPQGGNGFSSSQNNSDRRILTACLNWVSSPAYDPETMTEDTVLDEIRLRETKLHGHLAVEQRLQVLDAATAKRGAA